MDQSAARNVALEGTEISRDHAKFVAVARAERSTVRAQIAQKRKNFVRTNLSRMAKCPRKLVFHKFRALI